MQSTNTEANLTDHSHWPWPAQPKVRATKTRTKCNSSRTLSGWALAEPSPTTKCTTSGTTVAATAESTAPAPPCSRRRPLSSARRRRTRQSERPETRTCWKRRHVGEFGRHVVVDEERRENPMCESNTRRDRIEMVLTQVDQFPVRPCGGAAIGPRAVATQEA